jgi:phage baseplate assembly protein gpV
MPDVDSGYEMIRKIAERELGKIHLMEYGKVESVNIHSSEDDGIGYTCAVQLVGRTTDDGEMLKLENVPISTGMTGKIDVPYVDDLVLVSYINGDFELPVIIGRLYSREKTPPLFEDGQHLTEIAPGRYHSDGPEKSNIDIKFVDGAQTTINITDSSVMVTVGNMKMTIISGDESKIELEAGSTKLSMEEDGDISFETSTNINIKSDADVSLEASGNVNIKGSKINLN